MYISVLLSDKSEMLFGTLDYQTNEGELDILEDGIVVTTFAKGEWIKVSRNLEEGEELPESIRPESSAPIPDEEEKTEPVGNPRVNMHEYMHNDLLGGI